MVTRICGLILLLAACAIPAQAGVVVKIGDLSWNEGQPTGVLDVFVRASDGSTATIDNLGLEFQITADVGTSQIRFASTQTFPSLASELDYLFSTGGSAFGSASTTSFTDDTAQVGDASSPPTPVVITDTFRLLTRLELVAGPGSLAPVAGDIFTVSLVSLGVNTVFYEDESFVTPVDIDAITTGKITVQGGPVVPEPSSGAALLIAAACGCLRWRRRKTA